MNNGSFLGLMPINHQFGGSQQVSSRTFGRQATQYASF
jgi:hypothetical protein